MIRAVFEDRMKAMCTICTSMVDVYTAAHVTNVAEVRLRFADEDSIMISASSKNVRGTAASKRVSL